MLFQGRLTRVYAFFATFSFHYFIFSPISSFFSPVAGITESKFSILFLIAEGFQARQYNGGWKKETLEAPQTNISPGITTLIFIML